MIGYAGRQMTLLATRALPLLQDRNLANYYEEFKTINLTYEDFTIMYKKNNSGCTGFNQI